MRLVHGRDSAFWTGAFTGFDRNRLRRRRKGVNDKSGFVAGEAAYECTAVRLRSSTSISTNSLPIQIEVSDAPLTSDAGLLPLRQFDERIGLTKQFAAVLDDPRDPELIEHTFLEMVRSRVFGILAGYEDQNDHDTLRTDPVFKLIADRSPDDDGPGQPAHAVVLELISPCWVGERLGLLLAE